MQFYLITYIIRCINLILVMFNINTISYILIVVCLKFKVSLKKESLQYTYTFDQNNKYIRFTIIQSLRGHCIKRSE